MLTLWRRHGPGCKHTSRTNRRCSCPIWIEGTSADGRTIKPQSLKTRLWADAERKRSRMDTGESAAKLKQAIQDFLTDTERRGLSWETVRKYRKILEDLEVYAEKLGVKRVDTFTLEELRRFAGSRGEAASTGRVELERLSSFFKFCQKSGWITSNPIEDIDRPKVRLRPTEPYTPEEVAQILAVANGKDRAFLLVGRYTGLRISDVATLPASRIQDGKLLLYTQKTGQPVHLPLPGAVIEALEKVKRTSRRYYFWTGRADPGGVARSWANRLKKVFDGSGVEGAHFHRLRDTFAVELLLRGTPLEEVSILLGHSSIRITEKHYAPWVRARQNRLEGHVRGSWADDPILNEPYIPPTIVN